MPTASAYGTTNPRGLEPWPIEQTLAPLAVGNSQAEAQMMLENYQQQRDAAANVYSGDLQQQHQYAYDQLAQQMQEGYLKALPENAKAGTLPILASSPQYQAAFGGADPNAIAGVVNQSTRLQNADIAQKGGAGVWSLTNAGMPPTQADTQGITGLNVNPGTPLPVQVAQLKLQGDLARAAASGGGGIGVSFTGAPNAALGGASPNITIPRKMTLQQGVDAATRAGLIKPPINVPPPDTQPGSPAAQPNTGGASTVAKTDTPANHAPAATTQAPSGQITNDVKNRVRTAVETTPITPQNQSKIADIKAGYLGGQPNIVMTPQGPAIQGKSGKQYRD